MIPLIGFRRVATVPRHAVGDGFDHIGRPVFAGLWPWILLAGYGLGVRGDGR